MNPDELAQQIKTIQDQLKLLQKETALHASLLTDQLFQALFSQLQGLGDYETVHSPLDSTCESCREQFLIPPHPSAPSPPRPSPQATEEKWRSLSVCSPVGIFTCDVEGQVTYTNPKCQEMGGFTLEEGLGTGFADVIHSDDRILNTWLRSPSQGSNIQMRFESCNLIDLCAGYR